MGMLVFDSKRPLSQPYKHAKAVAVSQRQYVHRAISIILYRLNFNLPATHLEDYSRMWSLCKK